MKAVILAGGAGTRLKPLVSDRPKVMADIGGKPFLEYLLGYLIKQGISEVVISLHYMSDYIIEYFGDGFNGLKISYAVEDEPLGTGGAIMNALNNLADDIYFVLNGDCFQEIDYKKYYAQNKNHDFSVALRNMPDTARYGRVEVSGDKISSFREKGISGGGLINAGCYLINSGWLRSQGMARKFSIETDFLMKRPDLHYFMADGYFVDIGIPEDYSQAQIEVPARLKNLT